MSTLEEFVKEPNRDIGDTFGSRPGERRIGGPLEYVMIDALNRIWRVSIAQMPESLHCHNVYELAFDPDPERQHQAFRRQASRVIDREKEDFRILNGPITEEMRGFTGDGKGPF